MNEIIEHNKFQAPITFDMTLEFALTKKKEAEAITLKDWKDLTNYSAAKEKLKEVRSCDKAVYNRKRVLKGEAEVWLKTVESRAKELQGPLSEAEAHLKKQIEVRDAEIAHQKAEAERIKNEKLEEMHKLANSVNWQVPIYMLSAYLENPEGFQQEYETAKGKHLEAERIASENAEKAAEYQRAQEDRIAELEARARAEDRAIKEKLKEVEEKEAQFKDEHRQTIREVNNPGLYLQIKVEFDTLPKAWAEIVRLREDIRDTLRTSKGRDDFSPF